MRKIAAIILSVSGPFFMKAQPSFNVDIDTNKILIGEQFKLSLSAELEEGQQFIWPILPDSIRGIEVVDFGKVDTSRESGVWKIQQQLTLTSWDSGYVAIPPLSFKIGDKIIRSDVLAIGVLMPQVSDNDEMYDIKGPVEAPFKWWPVILLILAIIALGIGVFILLRTLKERKAIQQMPPEKRLTPYEYAQLQLSELKAEKLVKNGKIKEYYSRLTDIMRLYMEREMRLNAMESTADEVVELVNELPVTTKLREDVERLMELSVLVKYAKETPDEKDHKAAMKTIEKFLEENKPMETEEPKLEKAG